MKDHLGNNRVVMCSDDVVAQATDYYPFDATHDNALNPERQPYKFGGKELDEMHGLNQYDFQARRMSRDIPRFTTMDPLAEKYYNISPYAYCGNNPVNRIDPDGMDDYEVNQEGKITLLNKTEDKTDRLIALGKNNKLEYDDDGNITNTSFTVDKGILNNQKKTGETTYMSVKGNEQAKGLFEFLSENTTVEWGRVSYGKSSNYLTTNNDAYSCGLETIVYEKLFKGGNGGLIKSIDHSHPNETFPSGFPEVKGFLPKGQGDKAFAEWMYKYYPQIAPTIKLRVYMPSQQKYVQYNNNKIFK